MQNGTIALKVTPYVGTYDGQEHNALSEISVEPSDAKLEYSLDGENYVTEMPKIKDTSEFSVTVVASKEGYKTVSTTETVKVNKAEGSLKLSATSGTIECPNSTTFTVSGNTGTLSVSSSNTSVAIVSISGNTVTVKSVGAGSATITVKSTASTNYNEKTAIYTVTVKDNTFREDSGVGYYADTDGDGTPDGIIFADFKKGGSGSWGGTSYTISTKQDFKEYYISQESYTEKFGTKSVLSTKTSGNERFDIMALSDYDNGTTYPSFIKLSSTSYQCGIIAGEWRTPTKEKWAIFGSVFGITTSNYSKYGLAKMYWTSTNRQQHSGSAYFYVDSVAFSQSQFSEIGGYIYIGTQTMLPERLTRTF